MDLPHHDSGVDLQKRGSFSSLPGERNGTSISSLGSRPTATDSRRVMGIGLGKSLEVSSFLSVGDDDGNSSRSPKADGSQTVKSDSSMRQHKVVDAVDPLQRVQKWLVEKLAEIQLKLFQKVEGCFEEQRSEQLARTEFLRQMLQETTINSRAETSKLQAQMESMNAILQSMVPDQMTQQNAAMAQIQRSEESCTAATRDGRVVLQDAMRLKSELTSLFAEHQESQEAKMNKLTANVKEVDTNLQAIMHEQLAKQAVLESRMQRLEELGSSARREENRAFQESMKLKGDLQELMDERQKEVRNAVNDVMSVKAELDAVFQQRRPEQVALQDVTILNKELEVCMDMKQKNERTVPSKVVVLKNETCREACPAATRAGGVQKFQVGDYCAMDAVAGGRDEAAPTVITQALSDAAMNAAPDCVDTGRLLHVSNLPETHLSSLRGKEGRFYSDCTAEQFKSPTGKYRSIPEASERCTSPAFSEPPPLDAARISSVRAPSNVKRAQVLTGSTFLSATSQGQSTQRRSALDAAPRAATILNLGETSSPCLAPRAVVSGGSVHPRLLSRQLSPKGSLVDMSSPHSSSTAVLSGESVRPRLFSPGCRSNGSPVRSNGSSVRISSPQLSGSH